MQSNTDSKTICILQITRTGDLLQTFQAASALKQERPDVRLILIARKQFSSPIRFLLETTFDIIIELSLPDLIAHKKPTTLKEFVSMVAPFVQKINEHKIDVLINFSYSKSSNHLASLIKADHKLGTNFNELGQLSIKDKWSTHTFSSVMCGPYSPFNLVDIFKGVLGVETAFKPLPKASVNSKVKSIVVHPFASQSKKMWKEHKWSELIYRVLKEEPTSLITIVGAASEAEQASRILATPLISALHTRVQNCCGKLSFQEVAQKISEASLFIGHDSVNGHLASIYGTPSITLSLGPVRPHETTPYGASNIALAPKADCFPCFLTTPCKDFLCHNEIHPQLVTTLAVATLKKQTISKEFLKLIPSFVKESTRIYLSEITSANLFNLKEIGDNSISKQDIHRTFYRMLWLYLFSQKEEKNAMPEITSDLHKELYATLEGLQSLYELAEFGKKYSRFIIEDLVTPTPNFGLIKKNSEKIEEIDVLQDTLKKTHPQLSPLIDYFKVCKANLLGDTLAEMTESSFWTFSDYSTSISILYDLIEKTITEFKIKKMPAGKMNYLT